MCIAPILAAIKKTEDILGAGRIWQAQNEDQAYFLEHFYKHHNNLSAYSEQELRSWVSWYASELNEILAREGSSHHFEEFPPGNFGFLSIRDVLVHWLEKGAMTKLSYEGNDYPAVYIGNDEVFSAFSVSGHPHPVVCIHTKSGDNVFMSKSDAAYQGFGLARKVDTLSLAEMRFLDAASVIFPMINYDSEKGIPVDLSFLVGMSTKTSSGDDAAIEEIKQQTKFKKNHEGARVKSFVSGRVSITSARMPAQPIVIDEPYLEWHIRPGAPLPTFCAYWTPEDWSDPGNPFPNQ